MTLKFDLIKDKKGNLLELGVHGLREGPLIIEASVLGWLAKLSSEGGLWPYKLRTIGHDPHKLVAKCILFIAWPQAEALRATTPLSKPPSSS